MRTKLILGTAMALFAAGPALAEDMVFTSWGGTTQDAQQEAWAVPFAADHAGVNVLMDGPTDYGKLKAMVEAGSPVWDVVDVEYDFAVQAAKEGLVEPVDFNVVDRKAIDPRFVTDHAVGSFYYSFVLGYNEGASSEPPASWADVFDTDKHPGKRAFYKWSAPGALEIALLADGVAPKDLYPLDLDRAFAKLDAIKGDIVWWGSGAESQQLLASGEASLGQFWNGRLYALQQEGAPVGISWAQNLTAADMLVVPKGAKHKDLAMQFLARATSPEGQAKLAELTAYAPVTPAAQKLMDEATVKGLPDQHTEGQIDLDMAYWADHRGEIADRWYAWQAQ
ncbi:MAG: ABC transporter substrate-binding protein [Geminicoccaceae bacterium]|nr:ABC transporter substrate-binding protein [Geminicoccaceae bacterium]